MFGSRCDWRSQLGRILTQSSLFGGKHIKQLRLPHLLILCEISHYKWPPQEFLTRTVSVKVHALFTRNTALPGPINMEACSADFPCILSSRHTIVRVETKIPWPLEGVGNAGWDVCEREWEVVIGEKGKGGGGGWGGGVGGGGGGGGGEASAEGLFVGCLTSQQHACVSQGRIRSHNSTCCHTEQKQQHQRKLQPKIYTSHIKLSTVYMYPHISSWRHSEKRADSN